MEGREIILGVSGSIACYKAADLASTLVQRRAGVTVVMTEAATRFVTPVTFEALTHRPVLVDLFDREYVASIAHVTLADRAHLVVLAPATANLLAKLAHGLADDLLTSLVLACRAPILVAPAMNDNMFANPVVQANLRRVRELGMRVLDPESGMLACGHVGLGRLAEPDRIVDVVAEMLAAARPAPPTPGVQASAASPGV
ncbi:MAG: hypothetical protein HYZ53_23830 [Planctomycetes bacterium]|nr:hypothetical protein [Planctomycetota bacterium]